MPLKMWMYDLAREQSPTLDHLYQIASLTQESGYDALGLYLEHRYAYPSLPWAHGRHCLTPEMVRSLRSEFPSLRLIPFINLLGHFEGFLYTEQGKQYREEMFTGMQANPANPEFVQLCHSLIDDTLEAFDDEIIHLGGDETQQLGVGHSSQELMRSYDQSKDLKAQLYGQHFGPLCEKVVGAGRRPALWGDMFEEHPEALDLIPKQTLIFDWKYFTGVAESSRRFTDKGFEVVGCPTIQTYNAVWMHVRESEANIREVYGDVQKQGLFGTCVTTWELALMGNYDSIFPAIRAAGEILNDQEGSFYAAFGREGDGIEEWARLMSDEVSALGGSFTPGQIRSSLKVRLLLNANPFLAWMHHSQEFCETDMGPKAIQIAEQALFRAAMEPYKGPAVLLRGGVEFVQICEQARQEYAYGHPEAAAGKLAASRQVFDDLAKYARWNHARIGGSMADIERCRVAKEHIERVMVRIRNYGDGKALGYLPAWEVISHPKFMPHDQGCWWLINKWANQ